MSYDRKYEKSPFFIHKNSAISDSNYVVVSWETEDTSSKKYLPFGAMKITNNGEDDIYVCINQDENQELFIAKNTSETLDRDTIPAINSFKYKRAGSTNISANKIMFTCWREGVTADSMIQKIHRGLFKW